LPSTAVLFGTDAKIIVTLAAALRAHGWQVTTTVDGGTALAPDTALVVIDTTVSGAAGFLNGLRSLAPPASGVPVLQHGGTRLFGASAMLPQDDEMTPIGAVESFTGALSDHALRRWPFSPFYRLARLLGTRDAAAMMDRFAESLKAALARTPPSYEEKHRLAGLAGAVGYGELGLAWRNAEHGGIEAETVAIAATRAIIADIEHGDVARYRA
jgi:hypothetical protein